MTKPYDDITKQRIETTRKKLKIKYENIDILIGNLVEDSAEAYDLNKKGIKEIESEIKKSKMFMTSVVKQNLSVITDDEYDKLRDYLDDSKYEKLLSEQDDLYDEIKNKIDSELGKLYTVSHLLKKAYKELGKEND